VGPLEAELLQGGKGHAAGGGAFLPQDQGQLFEFCDTDHRAQVGRDFGTGDEDQFIPVAGLGKKISGRGRGSDQAQFQPAVGDPGDDLLAVADLERDPDLFPGRGKTADQGRQEILSRGVAAADLEAAALGPGMEPKLFGGPVLEVVDAPGVGQEELPGRGQADLFAAPFQELDPEVVFQAFQMAADRRLGEVNLLRGPAEALN